MIERLKKYLKAHYSVVIMNLTTFECPECCKKYGYSEYPARAYTLYDEQYHKYKFYLKCKDCNLVTPAYEDLKDLMKYWEELWVTEDVKTWEKGE